jgi:hypothetical protein
MRCSVFGGCHYSASRQELVCSGGGDAIHVLRGAGFQSRLEAAGLAASDLIDGLMNKDSKNCPVPPSMTDADKAEVLRISRTRSRSREARRASPIHLSSAARFTRGVRPLGTGDVAAEVTRKKARLLQRGHHRRGRLVIIPRALRPDPERTLGLSGPMVRIDVSPSLNRVIAPRIEGQRFAAKRIDAGR